MEHVGIWERLRRVDHRIWDALLAVVLLAGSVAALMLGPREGTRASTALGVALLLVATVPLALRRRAPLVVATIAVASDALLTSLGYQTTGGFAVAIALYTAAAYRPREQLIPVLVPLAAVEAVAFFIDDANWVEVLLGVTFAAGIPIAIGRNVFNRRARISATPPT